MDVKKIYHSIETFLLKDKSQHGDWNRNYFRIQKERYIDDLAIFNDILKSGSVLEIGGAPFHMSALLKESGYDLTILDIEPNRFEKFILENKLDVIKCDIEYEKLPVEDKSQDLIVLTEVFEHLRINPISTLKKIQTKVKHEGYFYLSTPNFYKVTNIISFFKGNGIVNAFYEFNKLNTIGHMGHVREYTKNEVELFLLESGFEIIRHEFKNAKKLSIFTLKGLVSKVFPSTSTHQYFLVRPKKESTN